MKQRRKKKQKMKKVMTLLNVINKDIQDLNLSEMSFWIYKNDSGFWILVHIKKKLN